MARPQFLLAFFATVFVALSQPNPTQAMPPIPIIPIPIIPIPGGNSPSQSKLSETLQEGEEKENPLGAVAHLAHGLIAGQASLAGHLAGLLPLLSNANKEDIKTDLNAIRESLYTKLIAGLQGQLQSATEEELQGSRMKLYSSLIEKLQEQLTQMQQVQLSSSARSARSVNLQGQALDDLRSKLHESLKEHLQSVLDDQKLAKFTSLHDSLLTSLQGKSKEELDSMRTSLYSKLSEALQGQLQAATQEELQGPRMKLYSYLVQMLQEQLAKMQQVQLSSQTRSANLQGQSLDDLRSTLYSKLHESLKGHLQSVLDDQTLAKFTNYHDSFLTNLQGKSKEELDSVRMSMYSKLNEGLLGQLSAATEEELEGARMKLYAKLSNKLEEQLQNSALNATEKDALSCIPAVLNLGNRFLDFGREGLNSFNINLNTGLRIGGCAGLALTPNLALDCIRNALQDGQRVQGLVLQNVNNIVSLLENDVDNIAKQCTTPLGAAL